MKPPPEHRHPASGIEALGAALARAGVHTIIEPGLQESPVVAAGLAYLARRAAAGRSLPARVCWSRIRYRQHFRPAAALRELRRTGGQRTYELTVDAGQLAPPAALEGELRRVLDGPLPAAGTGIGPFVRSSCSPMWQFNAAFWRHLPRFMQAVGRDFRDSIAGSPDTDRTLTEHDARRFIARLRAAAGRPHATPLAYLDVGAAGTEHAAAMIGHLAAARVGPVDYVLGDISAAALQRARQRLGRRRDQVTLRYVRLDLQQPYAPLARYRGRILTAHLTNVLDNLPGEQLALADGRHYLLQTQLYLPAVTGERLAATYRLHRDRLATDVAAIATTGVERFLAAYGTHLAAGDSVARRGAADGEHRLMLFWQDLFGNPADRRTGLKLRERLVEIPDLAAFEPWPPATPGLEHIARPGAVLRESLATAGSYTWMHLSERAIGGCLQLLALLHPHGVLEITDILLRDPAGHYAAHRGPAKFDGSVVEWFNGALFQAFARCAFPACRFRSRSLAAAGKPHMTRLEVRRGDS